MQLILVGVGANLPGVDGGPPRETCERAVRALAQLPGLRLVAVSRWHDTAAEPPSAQPRYINGVARLELAGEVEPEALLAALQEIEHREGRRRSAPNAARTLDLDLIAFDDRVRAAPDPVLPHPRAHQRDFVLVPLAEVAPGWVHPVLGRSVEALIAALPTRRSPTPMAPQ